MSNANAAESSNTNKQGFAITDIGDAEFGENGIGVWVESGNVRLSISNSFSPLVEKFSGAGTVDTQLTHSDQDEAKELFGRLCEAAGNPPAGESPEDRMTTYSVRCMRDGKPIAHRSWISDLPRELAESAMDFYRKVLKRYSNNPDVRNVVRVEAMIANVQRQKNGFLVSAKFLNRGRYPISIRMPDEWPTTWHRRFLVTGWNEKNEDVWQTNLSGMPVINKEELSIWTRNLPDGIHTYAEVQPGQSVTFRIPVVPDVKVPKGTYRFAASIITTMMTGRGDQEIENGSLDLSLVNLGTSESAHATFDTDYPSTPEEWKEYEARERAKRSSQLIEPGETVPGVVSATLLPTPHAGLADPAENCSPSLLAIRASCTPLSAPNFCRIAD